MKQKILILVLVLLTFAPMMVAQESTQRWIKVDRNDLSKLPAGLDTLEFCDVEQVEYQPTMDKYRVVTNRFRHNWWVFVDAGIHTFQGDFSNYGSFGKTLSPNFSVGVGKWFTPGFGIKGSMGIGNSRGWSEDWTGYTAAHDSKDTPHYRPDGTPYWRLYTKWWDGNLNAVFNLSRILFAWEGYDVKERMNQFILTVGMGWVHHYGDGIENFPHPFGGPKNEWYGNLELQYSRFFTKAKAWSLDVKLKGKFYETHFDLNTLHGRRWDYNAGISIGATYYIKNRGWDRCLECQGGDVYYINYQPIIPVEQKPCPVYKTFTFYVFYPNNYSGRDDAPVVADADVNSMDYLAGGIFTQRRFDDNTKVERNLERGIRLNQLATENIPTQKATFTSNPSGVARGYEITDRPISLSMAADSLDAFENVMGYFYSPIYEGPRTWYYRVDEATATQALLSDENYKETKSYGLNSFKGLETVRKNMPVEADSKLVSFADVYAAIEGDEGYIYDNANPATVAEIQRILNNGTILNVTAEGLATSQDNFVGEDAVNVGLTRNKTLSFNRALSPILWLKNSNKFKGVSASDFVINELSEPIGQVDDKSTRDLNAKLKRCARIKISYMIEE